MFVSWTKNIIVTMVKKGLQLLWFEASFWGNFSYGIQYHLKVDKKIGQTHQAVKLHAIWKVFQMEGSNYSETFLCHGSGSIFVQLTNLKSQQIKITHASQISYCEDHVCDVLFISLIPSSFYKTFFKYYILGYPVCNYICTLVLLVSRVKSTHTTFHCIHISKPALFFSGYKFE